MGYYTDYSIEVQTGKDYDGTLMSDIRQNLVTISVYAGWHHKSPGYVNLIGHKWYNHETDMVKLSKAFPDIRFEMHCQGEDGQQWMVYAFGGKVERCESEVVFAKRTLW